MPNTNKRTIDLPFFELCNQAPIASLSLSSMTTVQDGTGRYIYYLSSSTFYRYDTQADTWQQLATPSVAPVTLLNLKYTNDRGFHGRILSATASSVVIPSLRGNIFNGQQIKILSGTGKGQVKTLTFTGESILDSGVITATTANYLQDGLKKWVTNQWAGYIVGITFGTDATQYKKILYNDINTLYVADANLQPNDSWSNQSYVAVTPFSLPVATAGVQSHYVIMSSSYTLDSNWTIPPDNTSFFTLLSGGIYLLSAAAATPFYTFQYYDIIHDSWQVKTVPQLLESVAFGTDSAITITDKQGGTPYSVNTGAISATIRTLSDAGSALSFDKYANHRIFITGGMGMGQNRRIVGNTATVFTVEKNWDTNPDATSTYEIWSDTDRVYVGGNALARVFAYSPEGDYWMQGQAFDDGVIASSGIHSVLNGWRPISVLSGTRIAAGIVAINSVPTVGGTLYSIGDILTCAVGGAGAQIIVTSIAPGGIVTGLQLLNSGTTTGYTASTGNALTGGTGSGCTLSITSIGATANIATSTNNFYKVGQAVTFSGCNDVNWNASYTILGVSSLTVFSVACPNAAATMVATATQSTTTVYDPSKNWVTNEHVGRLVHLMVAGVAPTSQVRWVTANTSNTLTVATIVAGVAGSKYVIYDSKVFGIDDQRKEDGMKAYGYGSVGGSTTTLVDLTKNWVPNQWAGYLFKIEAGTGYGSGRISIVSNTANTLTFATQAFTPDVTSKYEIADSWGLITTGGSAAALNITEATTKNWAVNQWAGKRVRYTAGTNIGIEGAIASNTLNSITTAVAYTTDTTTAYAILSIPVRGSGIELLWAHGATDGNKGRFMYLPRGGGSNTFDKFDITTGRWTFGLYFYPQNEGFTTGSSFCYDGANVIYMSRSAANVPIRVFGFDVTSQQIIPGFTTTWLQGTVNVGNFMEIVKSSPDNYKYLYTLQNTGTLLSRALVS